jgi:hypothetical protein
VRALAVAGAALVVVLATPAAAENPIYDAETAADIAAAFAEATEAQGVCYSVTLDVNDPSGQWGGSYAVSSAGVDLPPPTTGCTGLVQLQAFIAYASEYSESADTASWDVTSDVSGVTAADLAANGLSATSLLDDAKSEEVLLNAALALPRLAAEKDARVPAIVLTPAAEAPPGDARATGRPGSDALRQNKTSVVLLGLLAAGALAWAYSLVRRPRRLATRQIPYRHHTPTPEQL